jgi:Pyruvate/2-oxoacid:ferredoxin oxidoreductase gamma subunit
METLVEAVRTMVPAKIEANIQAVREAFGQVKVYEVER